MKENKAKKGKQSDINELEKLRWQSMERYKTLRSYGKLFVDYGNPYRNSLLTGGISAGHIKRHLTKCWESKFQYGMPPPTEYKDATFHIKKAPRKDPNA